eukprot:364659-Chlamydomonas_euryale.AAC.7
MQQLITQACPEPGHNWICCAAVCGRQQVLRAGRQLRGQQLQRQQHPEPGLGAQLQRQLPERRRL